MGNNKIWIWILSVLLTLVSGCSEHPLPQRIQSKEHDWILLSKQTDNIAAMYIDSKSIIKNTQSSLVMFRTLSPYEYVSPYKSVVGVDTLNCNTKTLTIGREIYFYTNPDGTGEYKIKNNPNPLTTVSIGNTGVEYHSKLLKFLCK